jgi:hypothetical protein
MRTSSIIGAIAILVIGGVVWYWSSVKTAPQDFEVDPGILRLIQVSTPLPNQKVTSPLTIRGKAVGNWYFEASFPVKILDSNGNTIGVSHAEAQGDWMTEEFVPFEITLTFDKPTTETGILALMKDNPSGLPEHDNSISIPVSF